jgi:hypothetical protein
MKYFMQYTKVQYKINSLKTKLGRKLLDKTINKFYKTIYSDKVER